MAVGSPSLGRPRTGEKETGRVDLHGGGDIATLTLQTTSTNNESDSSPTRAKLQRKNNRKH
jgi:hypothetical protein